MSFRADSAYCAIAACCLALLSTKIADNVGMAQWAVFLVGGAVAVWALLLWMWSARTPTRPVVRFVMIANFAVATGLGVGALTTGDVVLTALLAAVGLEVAAFGASQAISLLRLQSDAAR